MVGTLAILLFAMRTRMKPPTARSLFDMKAWSEAPFATFAIASLLGPVGLYIPYFYVESYARKLKVVEEANLLFYLVPLPNAGSVFGRIVRNC